MPQTFQVLRCFQCLVFQVHPTKKSNKWKCKMCGEKQSIKRYYGLGTGKECRFHAQKLNRTQGETHNAKLDSEDSDDSINSPDSIEEVETGPNSEEQNKIVPKKSKWADYVDMAEENEQHKSNQIGVLNEAEVVLELPKKQPRKSQHIFKAPSQFSSQDENFPLTKVLNNSIKHKTEKPKQCNTFNTNLCHTQLTDSHLEKKNHNKEVVLQTASNSKWAQYVEETEDLNDEDASINDQAEFQNDPPRMFSLFDDENLDTVLDF